VTTRLLAGAVAAGGAAAVMAWGRHRRTINGLIWERTNHAGHAVTLWEGAAYAKGAAVGALAGGSPAGALACIGGAVFGALDDHFGDSSNRGLKGHLGALTRGEVTTGAVKILGIGMTGLGCAVLTDRRVTPSARVGISPSTLTGAAVVAGAANLANLLDLRPGRALKVTVLAGVPLLAGGGGPSSAAAIGASLAVMAPDLRGESMLGDTGANAAGALIGVAAIERLGWRGRLIALAGLTALTLASERVSFTQVIESTPVLRDVDRWGRRR
jgi:hypothetical protein